ncbi:hypothetical protein AK812_SmicGene40634 [Symbiodinium microadriaticum]|uniref:Uncharacterized protein n=1 Tax=Symbiodinium microadriaticum TaxID=2951 RepID=A0A1Q9C864_SYMMI|nr:hypothetical protein AK812_SmicGene40634 [Symbiodinium microadriaticum]
MHLAGADSVNEVGFVDIAESDVGRGDHGRGDSGAPEEETTAKDHWKNQWKTLAGHLRCSSSVVSPVAECKASGPVDTPKHLTTTDGEQLRFRRPVGSLESSGGPPPGCIRESAAKDSTKGFGSFGIESLGGTGYSARSSPQGERFDCHHRRLCHLHRADVLYVQTAIPASNERINDGMEKLGGTAGFCSWSKRLNHEVRKGSTDDVDDDHDDNDDDDDDGGRHSEQCPVLTSWPLPPHSVSSRPQQETMTVDNSQGLNPEADIFRHCMVGQQDQDRVESGQKRPRPNPKPQLPPQRGYRRFPNRGQSEESELVQALARLALRQETQLAELRMDKGLVMFFRQDQISILPGLYAVSKEYNAMVAEGSSEITTPLRTLLLACLMRQFRERVVHMMSSMEGVSKLQAAGWLTADQVWTRQKWCRQTKKLVLDQKAEGMKHADLLSSIDFLLTNLRGGPRAYEVHLRFLNLIGISALQLIGLSLKRESLQRSPAAKQLEALLYKR